MDKVLRIGFYAPMKSPNHGVASGDRRMAQGFVKALRMAGFEVHIISDLRTYLGSYGDKNLPQLRLQADEEFDRVRSFWQAEKQRGRGLDLLFCYHVYHKSPDLLLYRLSAELDVPYVIAEASYAEKLRGGDYDKSLALSAEAILSADVILQLNPKDYDGLVDLYEGCGHEAPIVPIGVFSDFADVEAEPVPVNFGGKSGEDKVGRVFFVVHAMMRYGDKYRSYEVLADSFRVLLGREVGEVGEVGEGWCLVIIGGGEAEQDVRSLFSDFGDKVYFAGLLGDSEIRGWLEFAHIYVWPGVNEAYGMGILEAVICGLPVIVGDRPGIRGCVGGEGSDGGEGGGLFCEEGNAQEFAEAILRLYDDYWGGGDLLAAMGDCNRRFGAGCSMDVAAEFLRRELKKLMHAR